MRKRQIAFFIAKICFATVVIVWLFHKADIARVWAAVRDARRLPVLLGIGLGVLTVMIAGWRWQRLLKLFDFAIPLRSLICIAQVGQFFMMFLPGPTGDDLTRMLYISRLAPGRVGEACTSVLLDRCIGLASILFMAVICIPSQWNILASSSQTHWLAALILGSGVALWIAGILFFLAGNPTGEWFEKRLRSLPARSFHDEAIRIWGLLCTNKILVAQVIGAAIITQSLLCVLFYLAGISVGIHMPIFAWFTFIPIVLAANALPITIAGLGVREYLIVLFLGVIARVESERALAASIVTFSIILTVALLGGLLYVFYRPRAKENGSVGTASSQHKAIEESAT